MSLLNEQRLKRGDLGSMGDSCSRFEEVGDSLASLGKAPMSGTVGAWTLLEIFETEVANVRLILLFPL